MGMIINDFSINGQFADRDAFCDSILDKTIPVFDVLKDFDIEVLKSWNTYSLMVTQDESLNDIMRSRGKAEITKLKSQLKEIFFDEPYWDDDVKSKAGSIYECEFTDELEGYCLAEALERKFPVISFEHDNFKDDKIFLKRDEIEENILNVYDYQNLLETLKNTGKITPFNHLCKKYKLKDSFGLSKGKNLFEELVKDASLSENDVDVVIRDMMTFMDAEKMGNHIPRFSKTIDGDLKEFRTSLSNNREIRIFYFKRDNSIVYLNGFLKKTQKTPRYEIDMAKKIMKEML